MKKSVRDIDVKGKKVIVRCDLNVPQDEDGKITDDNRILASLDTIRYLLEEGAAIILMSHLGRPRGEAVPGLTIKPVADRLSSILEREIKFISSPTVVDEDVRKAASELRVGEIILLENLRYRKEETENERKFSEELASLADIYINDAFGTSHRAHCSTVGITEFLPAVSGLLVEKELEFLGKAVENPKRPFLAIMGGAKVADKIPVIENLLEKIDSLIIGGGMAYTFLKAKGYEVGKSLLEEDMIATALKTISKAEKKGITLLLPVDIHAAKEFDNDAESVLCSIEDMSEEYIGLDIGRKTIEVFEEEIGKARTIVWNGPMGVFEMANFAAGTEAVGRAMAKNKGITIIGGGDSAAAVRSMHLDKKMTHLSTGGGASLKFLEGEVLPGIRALDDR